MWTGLRSPSLMDTKEKSDYNLIRPTNCLINKILGKDKKGVSNLYKYLHEENNSIITNICAKWSEKAELILHPYEVKNSFVKTNVLIDDIYLKYIQFRTLHYRFYTNDLLKCRIATTDVCSQCKTVKDSNSHMLLYCTLSCNLWDHVEGWIQDL